MSADVSVDKSVGVSVGVSVDVSVGVAVGAYVNDSVDHRGLPWYAVGAAVEIAVEIAMDSAMGLHGAPLLGAAFRGSPWKVRGSPWRVRGSPWSVRGCPWNRRGHGRRMSWRSVDAAAVFCQKNKYCTSLCFVLLPRIFCDVR